MRKSSGDYSHASHTAKVIAGSKVRCGARSVLFAMCQRAEFSKPEVTITKPQLGRMTGLERKAVQEALRRLREEGVIVPIEHFEGGRGNAVTYKLVALGQEQAATAPQEAKVGQIRTALARIMAENPKLTYGEARTLAEKAA